MPKALLSVPSACNTTRPSVSTPSTSNSSSLMRAAFTSIDTDHDPKGLEHLCTPQVMNLHHTGHSARLLVYNDDRRDLPLFHDVQRLGRKCLWQNADRVPR